MQCRKSERHSTAQLCSRNALSPPCTRSRRGVGDMREVFQLLDCERDGISIDELNFVASRHVMCFGSFKER